MRPDRHSGEGSENGEATVEFIGVVVAFLVPLFYFILALGLLQSSAYAAETAARNAARIVSVNPERVEAARIQADLAFADYGLEGTHQMAISCRPASCQPGIGSVLVAVDASVPLPLIPTWVTHSAGFSVHSEMEMPIEGVRLK